MKKGKSILVVVVLIAVVLVAYVSALKSTYSTAMRYTREANEALKIAKVSVIENYEPDIGIGHIQVHEDDKLGLYYFVPTINKKVVVAPESKTGQLIREAIRITELDETWGMRFLTMIGFGFVVVVCVVAAGICTLIPVEE